jgi:hypothetical protein
MDGSRREEPDDPLLSGHSTGDRAGLHSLAIGGPSGLVSASSDGRRGRPLTAPSQKSSAGIGHSRVANGFLECRRQLGSGPYVGIQ